MVILVEVVSNTKFSDLTLAATLVGFGMVDYLLTPATDTEEQVSKLGY